MRCLNPCFGGSWVMISKYFYKEGRIGPVLILVLVEVGL